jgi:hypothetical protein
LAKTLGKTLCLDRIKFYRGENTTRHVRHEAKVSEDEVKACGLADLPLFPGGKYSTILQISPIHGVSYTNIKLMPGCEFGSWIVVGDEGSTNFPRDEVHNNWKNHLLSQNFRLSCVEAANYTVWTIACINELLPAFQDTVFYDEWLKAIGRIHPEAVNLFVRFRVNVLVNYGVIYKGYIRFVMNFQTLVVNLVSKPDEDCDLSTAEEYARNVNIASIAAQKNRKKAKNWTEQNARSWLDQIRSGYVAKSRAKDGVEKGGALMENKIPGQEKPWSSLVTPETKKEFTKRFAKEIRNASPEGTFEKVPVDTVMSWALLGMTKRMAEIWALITLTLGGNLPDASVMNEYFAAGLASSAFPALPTPKNDMEREFINAKRKWFVGNPQYDPCGAVVALALLFATTEQQTQIHDRLDAKEKLVSDADRPELLRLGHSGESPEVILQILLSGTLPPKKN